jgi:hypothetical protein
MKFKAAILSSVSQGIKIKMYVIGRYFHTTDLCSKNPVLFILNLDCVNAIYNMRYEVLTVVNIKITVFGM